MTNDSPPFLEVERISKRFPGVKALSDVSLRIGAGESVAVIGENGAGKSTLMKILAGIQPPDEGTIRVNGQAVEIRGVTDALQLGIALIHQELNLCDNLSIGANIYLGREPRTFGWIDQAQVNSLSRKYLKQVGLDVDPRKPLVDLSIGQQQLVEIAKALSCNAKLLIMDEPTSSLSAREVDCLFAVITSLRDSGVSIVYISHRLSEVHQVCDRVVALRDGKNSGELSREEISHDNMVRLMVGRELDQFYAHQPQSPGEVVLAAKGIKTSTHPAHPISFQLRAGEIVGLAGLVGAGRTELFETLFGVHPPVEGTLEITGQSVTIRSPRDAIAHEVFLVPEDRKQQGLVLPMDVGQNTTLPGLHRLSYLSWIDSSREQQVADEMVKRMRVKTPSTRQIIQYLSGGNQQKVVIAKWLAMHPKVLLLDEPTRGIDVGAKHEIYELMEELARKGVAILFVSSEMEEILGMSDRVLVMHEGTLAGELSRDQLSEQAIMTLATGQSLVGAGEES
ncbi:sugar ABC transporter ATP-binding protein [Blastopirellula marina]|uniref:D-xylose ABC transporter ATP-binding protein n=1 Tax=Blastopirellula marina TaxID=124 RepID=A0A2S8G198_9BACT|nr:sugar ABC transporter ATP-binding protein [Blastopirellula marina]PQO38225.1 D-xylose ABC transporter ATP-binding protein [Blastopirellula marina]PTL44881.1 sugar ABC transporter ATP-binding protein [Blastopirellula marina]